MLLHDLLVVTRQFLPAECTDGHFLLGFDGRTVGVDGDAGAGLFSCLVLAVDAVLFGDGHGCLLVFVLWWELSWGLMIDSMGGLVYVAQVLLVFVECCYVGWS
jgi:hypothetical protein